MHEFSLTTGFADYLLIVDKKAIGVVEAKAVGATLSGVTHQSQNYGVGLRAHMKAWHMPLPYLYQNTGVETTFARKLGRALPWLIFIGWYGLTALSPIGQFMTGAAIILWASPAVRRS